jgi:hypothetical protein
VNQSTTNAPPVEYRAWVGVECPRCHRGQFFDLQLEQPVTGSPAALEIRRHLEAWLASRCPDHLGPILKYSRN